MTNPTRQCWLDIKKRCYNSLHKSYKNYGGRGVKLCDSWLVFANFLADMGEKPDGMTLDRINNNGDYSPENCRWSSRGEQARNRRNTALVNGKCAKEWAATFGIHQSAIFHAARRKGIRPEEEIRSRLANGRNE